VRSLGSSPRSATTTCTGTKACCPCQTDKEKSMTLEFETAEDLYQHYQAVAHRIGSRRYVYPVDPVVTTIAPRPRPAAAPTPEPVRIDPTPEEYWAKLVSDDLPKSRKAAERMLSLVAQKYGISYEDIVGPSRKSNIVNARQEAYWWLNRRFGFSTITTAQLIGGRDHTCVVQGVPKHEARMQAK